MISRSQFIRGLVGAGAGAAAGLWAEYTPFPDACVTRAVRVDGPAGWAGRRVVFVTDVHYGNHFGREEVCQLGALVRRLRPEAAILGGDLADGPERDLGEFFEAWSPGCTTLFSPGNHDVRRGLSGSVMPQARAAGLVVLCNESEAWNGVRFVGLPSALRARQDLSLLEERTFTVVLGHEPDVWDGYPPGEFVQLAGHTHAGQVRILGQPLRLPTLGRRYPWGVYRRPGRPGRLVVSAGVGCAGPYARINCPPEIVSMEFI